MPKAKYKWEITYTDIKGEKNREMFFIKWMLQTRMMQILKTCDNLTVQRFDLPIIKPNNETKNTP